MRRPHLHVRRESVTLLASALTLILVAAPATAPASVAYEPTGPAPTATATAGNFAGVITDPINARFLNQVQFGDRSHWLQPWRSYLDTPPAARLRDAAGMNFNVTAAEAPSVARLLAANGFRRARIEIAWGDIDYNDTSKLWRADEWRAKVQALRDAGLRPLVLLNSDHGRPTAVKDELLKTTSAITAGSRTVQLDVASAAKVVPGRTGFNGAVRAEAIITSLSGTTATLAKPMPSFVAPGTYPATTLRYAPFSPVTRADGSVHPAGEATMQGWIDYVRTVTGFVASELGSTDFDVEISNEANLNASFYDINKYYEPDPFPGRVAEDTIVERTVAWVKNPASGLPGVRVTNGFSSQRPWDSAATSPVGLDALSKHYYPRYLRFPSNALQNNRPIDAAGSVSGWRSWSGWNDTHNPTYDAVFPEFALTTIATESIVRDTAPITTRIIDLKGRNTAHGRNVTNAAGKPVEFWMTEINLETAVAKAILPNLTYADEEHLRAKSALRTLTSYVNKGMTQIDFYAASTREWTLIGKSFWEGLASTGAYPGDTSGGPTLNGVRRLTAALGDDRVTLPRKLTLASIGDYGGRTQFAGDGSAARPALHDRDVLAFLPFQASDTRFVIPIYVMTRNMAQVHAPGTTPNRLDLPAERFQLTIGGTNAATARVTATDPMTGQSVPADVVRRTDSGWLVVEMPVTDIPRLLTIDDA